MTEHVDIYALIAGTSAVLKKAVRQEGKSKYPKCIAEVQSNLAGKTIYADIVEYMQKTISKYDR